MPFLFLTSQITHKKECMKKRHRKEEDSAKTQPIASYFPKDEERASLFTSFRSAVTVEAALVLPLFLLALCCFCYLLEIMAIQTTIHSAAGQAGKELAKEAYIRPLALPSRIENDIVESVGAERLNRSIIRGGAGGIDCSKTVISPKTGIIQMRIEFQAELPINVFGRLSLTCKDEFRIKGWTGYVREGFDTAKEDVVYVTDTGLVYHRDYHCTYLDLSIRSANRSGIEDMRNEDGEKYRACEKCGGKAGENVYITDRGNRYHSSLSCSGLKRSVYTVPVSEVFGKGGCVRCGR